jgi:hypothetical protein
MKTMARVLCDSFLALAILGSAFPACSSKQSNVERSGSSSAAVEQPTPQLLIIQGAGLYGVATQDGSTAAVGTDDWTGASTLATNNAMTYAVQGSTLWSIDPTTGTRTALGTADWTGTAKLTAFAGSLYAVQGAGMYRIDASTGSYQRLGSGDWTGTSALTGGSSTYLYAVQGPGLYRIDPIFGTWSRVGTGDWTGTVTLTAYRQWLYAVQGAGLWQINPDTGTWARAGTGDWTGTTALTSDTRQLYAIQGAGLYSADPASGSWAGVDNFNWSGSVAMTAVSTAKTPKTVLLKESDFDNEIGAALVDMRLQLDQTDDPTHAGKLTARHWVCVPATAAEVTQCKAACPDKANGDPNLLKSCLTDCTNLKDCALQCGEDLTPDYITLGDGLKQRAQKPCTSPDVSCPLCTVGTSTSAVEDYDIKEWIPDPIFTTTLAGGPLSCRLNTFGWDTNPAYPGAQTNFTLTFNAPSIHLDIQGFASSPTLRCTNYMTPTVLDPHFLFDVAPLANNHHLHLGVTVNFSGHVDYAFDWAYSLDTTLAKHVRDAVSSAIGRFQGSIDQQFENWVAGKIKAANGDDVDDFIDAQVVGAPWSGITVTYTPLCVGGMCSCTPDCSTKACGADTHCGNVSCGSCFAGQYCDGSGTCQCAPQCAGKSCGPDGCGGSCGSCSPGQYCDGSGTCQCAPQCAGKSCGPDSCGGSCGPGCTPPYTCDPNGQCVCTPRTCAGTCGTISDGCGGTLHCPPCGCTPQCTGKRCGAGDGCGGFCLGYCRTGFVCQDDGSGPYCAPI